MGSVNKDPGKEAITFFEKLPLAGDYLGERFKLRPWQREIVESIFGRVDKDGKRLVRKAYISLPRKHAKTFLCAAIALYCLVHPPIGDQEVYSCAASRDQAGKIFEYMVVMINQTPYLQKRMKIGYQRKEITYLPKMNKYRALAASPQTVHGLSPNILILDELAQWSGPKAQLLYDGLTTGQGARKEPLQIIITTAGHNQDPGNLCFQEYQYSKKWLSGEIKNDNYYACIFEAEKDADPFDEAVWHKACPALGDFVNLDYMRGQAEIARSMPSKLNGFRTLYLNQWTDSAFAWIPTETWNACKDDYTLEDLKGRPCFCGFDWGPVSDMTALTLLFPMDDETFRVWSYCWIPRGTAKERSETDDHRYSKWIEKGLVRTTEGNATCYKTVKAEVLAILKQFQVQLFAADPTSAGEFLQSLKRAGIKTYNVQQSNIGLISAGAKNLEALILNGRIKHNGNPVFDWCLSNSKARIDFYENIRIVKGAGDTQRIDPVVCLVFAMSVATVILDQRPITLQMHN